IDLSWVALDMDGVPAFDRRVYEIARAIPAGATRTYGQIAQQLGRESHPSPEWGLAREVGQALGRNPFPIIVPCHRVLAADGTAAGVSARVAGLQQSSACCRWNAGARARRRAFSRENWLLRSSRAREGADMNWISNVVRPKIRNYFVRRDTPENLWIKCPETGQLVFYKDVKANQFVIPGSNY